MADTAPELQELIREAISASLLDVHVALPGIVQSYDSAKQTCSVLPAVKRPVGNDDGEQEGEALPVIPNVPVLFPRAGAFSLTYALAKGDGVLLVFNHFSPSGYRSTGTPSDPGDLRQHGPGYPVALPGWFPDASPSPDTDRSIGVPGGLRLHFSSNAISAGGGSDFVAMAAKVAADLSALKAAISAAATTETGASGLGGMAALLSQLGSWPAPAGVGSSNLKAD